MDYYHGNIPILEPSNAAHSDNFYPGDVSYGAVPRDYSEYPEAMFAQPDQMKLIEEHDWDAYYDEQEAAKSSLEHLYLNGPNGNPVFTNLDQNGQGFCWAYSTGHSIMLARMAMGLPVVMLSPHGVACKIKGFQDQGGWCGLSAKFARETGYPSQKVWPADSMSRSNDNAATWADAVQHKITQDWVDLTKKEYDQTLTTKQLATCGFKNIPAPSDFSWWSHSVCQVRWVRIEKGSWGPLILNSWLNWGRHGLAVLRGSQAIANGAVATLSATLSVS